MSSQDAYMEELKTLWREINGLKQRINDLMTEEHLTGVVGSVTSVNGDTGVVDLDADDINETASRIWFTSAEESKLAGIAAGAEVNVNADWNAVTGDEQILNKPTITAFAETLLDDADLAAAFVTLTLGTIATQAETAYALLAGRASGQTLSGGNAANEDLTLRGTSHATKTTSYIFLADDGGGVMIGSSSDPATLFEVRGSSGGMTLTRTSDTAGDEPFILLRKGVTPANIAQIRGIHGGGLRFTDGASSVEWARFDASGNLVIGAATATGKAHVDQASTTAAIPVLVLDQADVDQDMIEFVTTIGTGNAIEAVGAKVLTTTHFIKVTLPGALTRYIPCGTIA